MIFLSDSVESVLGKRIKELRMGKGWTIEKLAEMIEISSTYLGLVEKGKKSLRIENIRKLSDALDVSIDYLVKQNFKTNSRNDVLNLLVKDLDDKDFVKVTNIVRTIVEQFNA